ncbi:MAG: zf-HC2 domain-containing protein [Deltaproteobacteria bacterium]|nr:zf-HC2 domain-containing protein [Deltaproteobacteria bacterium]
MLSCKDTTRLISRSMDTSLPIAERIRVRLHILICKGCSRYERQLLLIREMLRRPDAAWPLSGVGTGETLSEEARERIGKSLRNA